MGTAEDARFDINREFYDKTVDPQLVMSMVTLMDRQIISDRDIFERLKAGGIIDAARTLEDVREELGDFSPLGS